jgi:RNA polymerase sigma-70 factor (ECF subfamily)
MGGDREEREFTDFYRATYQRTVATVCAVVGQLQEAEELTQEAYCRALRRWTTVSRYEVPEAWVRRVAVNLALSARRRVQRRAVLLLSMGRPEPVPGLSVDRVALMEALQAVPMRYRAAVVLHHVVDLPVDEVAAELGVSVNTVKTWLRRGRAALSGLLDDDNDGTERGVVHAH